MAKQKQGFTLVELIVTITILAILGTIAFISLQGYSQSSRDSVRISDVGTLKTSIELFYLGAGKYPETTSGYSVNYSGSTVWTQGTFGESTKNNVSKLDKIPLDPLTSQQYSYSTTKNKQEYQLAGILETNDIVMNSIANQALAGDIVATAFVSGNYNGKIIKTLSGTTCEILSIPSIISSEKDTTDLLTILGNQSLVYDGYNNLPGNFEGSQFKTDGGFGFTSNKLVVYSDNNSCSDLNSADATARKGMLANLKTAYEGTILENKGGILEIVNSAGNTELLAATIVNNNLGGNIVLDSGLYEGEGSSNFLNGILGGNATDTTIVLKTDNSGNIYIGGRIYNDSLNSNQVKDFSGNDLLGKSSVASEDAFVAKLDSSGNQQWIKILGGTQVEYINTLAVDSDGNVYVGGRFESDSGNSTQVKDFQGSDFAGIGVTLGERTSFVAKLNSLGEQQWIKDLGGDGDSLVIGLDTDSSGNVYVGGYYRNNNVDIYNMVDFNGDQLNGASSSASSNLDCYVAKLDTSGNQQWIKTMGGDIADVVYNVSIDGSGNVYVYGYFQNNSLDAYSVKDFGGGSFTGASSSSPIYRDGFIAKLDNSGNQQWINKFGGDGQDYFTFNRNDDAGNLYVGGYYENDSSDSFLVKDFNSVSVFGKSDVGTTRDGVIVKMDANGNQLGLATIGGSGLDYVRNFSVQSGGDLLVGGYYENDSIDSKNVVDFAGNTLLGKTNTSGNDGYIAKLNSSMTQQWLKTMGGTGDDRLLSVDDNNGKIYVGGYIENNLSNANSVLDFEDNSLSGSTDTVSFDSYVLEVIE